jgi:hypothetical protein
MISIQITSYTRRGKTGRACGAIRTNYAVNTTDYFVATKKAYATHQRRVDRGDLGVIVKIAGWGKGDRTPADYLIL